VKWHLLHQFTVSVLVLGLDAAPEKERPAKQQQSAGNKVEKAFGDSHRAVPRFASALDDSTVRRADRHLTHRHELPHRMQDDGKRDRQYGARDEKRLIDACLRDRSRDEVAGDAGPPIGE